MEGAVGAVGAGGAVRLPIAQAAEKAAAVRARLPRCAPSSIARTSKSKEFSPRSSLRLFASCSSSRGQAATAHPVVAGARPERFNSGVDVG